MVSPSRLVAMSQLDKPLGPISSTMQANHPSSRQAISTKEEKKKKNTKNNLEDGDYYRMPAEEDMYVPPGRKYYDREDLSPKEEEIELGPPTLQNDTIYRQQFAIKDYVKTLRQAIAMNDVSSKVQPQDALKPAIKDAFYIKEQRWVKPEFVEPDDEVNKYRETGRHVMDYMNHYKENPTYLETDDQTSKAIRNQLNKKIPLPGYARMKIAMIKKVTDYKQQLNNVKNGKQASVNYFKQNKANADRSLKDKIKDSKFKNNPKLTAKIKLDQPIFKRDIRKENVTDGHSQLHQKLLQSEHVIRQTKNGQTIFNQASMRTKYSNPYFKNQEMRERLLNLIDVRKPKLSPNPNINMYDEEQLPIPDKTNKAQAPWLKSPSSLQMTLSALNEHSDQTLNIASSKSPFAKVNLVSSLHVNSEDGAQSKNHLNSMNQSQFNFGAINSQKAVDVDRTANQSPTTAHFTQRPQKNKMLSLDLTQATHSHYPSTLDQNFHTSRNVASNRNNSFAVPDEVDFVGSSELPKMHHSFLTMSNRSPADQQSNNLQARQQRMRDTSFENSTFLSQNTIDPQTLLPPCTLSLRETGEKLEKELKFPISPAFVSIYKMNKDIKVPRAQDFCHEKNIPFSSEEHNYYRVKQSQARFKTYAHSVNKCYETSRPDDFEMGTKLLSNVTRSRLPPKDKVTKDFGDARLYVPNVYQEAHKKFMDQKKLKVDGSHKRNKTETSTHKMKKPSKTTQKIKHNDTFGKLYQALEGAHEQSKQNMLTVFQQGEQIKSGILDDLENKLSKPMLISPNKANLFSSSAESLHASSAHSSGHHRASSDNLKSARKLPEEKPSPAKKKATRTRTNDPIKKILNVNNRSFKITNKMNEVLVRILERYELDKPILMRDKLDMIWEKREPEPIPEPVIVETAEEEYARILKESSMSAKEAFDQKQEEKRKQKEEFKEKMQIHDNVNQYAVKFKLGKRKVYRAAVNAKQVRVYNKLLATMESRKAPKMTEQQISQQAYIRPMEVEREFLDAFSIIVQSGYFLEQDDFIELIKILDVSNRPSHKVERAKVLEFFQLAAELCDFDAELVTQIVSEPWDREAHEMKEILSKGYIFQNDNDIMIDQIDKDVIRGIELNQRSGLLMEAESQLNISEEGGDDLSSLRDPFRDSQVTHFGVSNLSQKDELGLTGLQFRGQRIDPAQSNIAIKDDGVP